MKLFYLILFFQIYSWSQSLIQNDYFDTWNGSPQIASPDPSGVTAYNNHLILIDAELNETSHRAPIPPGIVDVWNNENIFEISYDGSNNYGTDVYYECPSLNSTCSNTEPTGITYDVDNNVFYISNDNIGSIIELTTSFIETDRISTIVSGTCDSEGKHCLGGDPEGLAYNPNNNRLYVVDGSAGQKKLLAFNVNPLSFYDSYDISSFASDPEGIAFNESTGNLFIVSATDNSIFEVKTNGSHVMTYNISHLNPSPIAPQGLTFLDDELFIVDGGIDNHPDELDIECPDSPQDCFLDGGVYSITPVKFSPALVTILP